MTRPAASGIPAVRAGSRLGTFPPDLPSDAVPAGTKGKILASALVAFAGRGFHGTSIRTIADGCGINSATLYSHFPSKEHILAALVEIGSRALLARLQAHREPAASSRDRLDAIVRAAVLAHAEYPLLAVVTNSESHALSPELRGPAQAPTVEAAGMLRDILAAGIADGSFTITDPQVTAHTLEGMAQHIPHWLNPQSDAPEHLAAEYVLLARRIVGA